MKLADIIDRLKQLGYHQRGNSFVRRLSRVGPERQMTVKIVRKNGEPHFIWYCGNASIGAFAFDEMEEVLSKHRKIVAEFRKRPYWCY